MLLIYIKACADAEYFFRGGGGGVDELVPALYQKWSVRV